MGNSQILFLYLEETKSIKINKIIEFLNYGYGKGI